jgi:hypothetical protein
MTDDTIQKNLVMLEQFHDLWKPENVDNGNFNLKMGRIFLSKINNTPHITIHHSGTAGEYNLVRLIGGSREGLGGYSDKPSTVESLKQRGFKTVTNGTITIQVEGGEAISAKWEEE